MNDLRHLVDLLRGYGLGPDADRFVEPLVAHFELLYEWNAKLNLTSIRDRSVGWRRHLLESLAGLPLLPRPAAHAFRRLLDLGSGNGFPALPLLICREDLKGTLFEASARKVDFLRAVTRKVGLGRRVEIIHQRVKFDHPALDACEILTARAIPDPRGWSLAAADRAVSHMLLWLSSADTGALSLALDSRGYEVTVHPLPGLEAAGLLGARRRDTPTAGSG